MAGTLAVWPITIESFSTGRSTHMRVWSGDPGDRHADNAYLEARETTVGEKAIPWFKRKFGFTIVGYNTRNEIVYAEFTHKRRFRLEFPSMWSSSEHVKFALSCCEQAKKLRAGALTEGFEMEELLYCKPFDPNAHLVCTVWVETEGDYRSALNYFKYQHIPLSGGGTYQVTVHEDKTVDHVQQLVHDRGVSTCRWMMLEGCKPIQAVGVARAKLCVTCTDVKVHAAPAPPDPDVMFHAYDIECSKGVSREECLEILRDGSKRNKVPDPVNPNHAIRMISSVMAPLGKPDAAIITMFEWRPNPKHRSVEPFVVTRRGISYTVRDHYTSELEMLMDFERHERGESGERIQPVVTAGFWNHNFDLPYILVRKMILSKPRPMPVSSLVFGVHPGIRYEDFYDPERQERVGVMETCLRRGTLSPSAPGVFMFDACVEAKSGRYGGLKSYKLKDVCHEVLKTDIKDPLKHTDLEAGMGEVMTEERYRELCELTGTDLPEGEYDAVKHPWEMIRHYCALDSVAVYDLVEKRMWGQLSSISALHSVPIQSAHDKKSKYLVSCNHAQDAAAKGYLLNVIETTLEMDETKDGKKFGGGAVLEVDAGLHSCVADGALPCGTQRPMPEWLIPLCLGIPPELLLVCLFTYFVTTLDFESMYPHIMMRLNLSPDTIIAHRKPYPHEVCEWAELRRRGTPAVCETGGLIDVPYVPEDVLRKLPAGLWAEAPGSDVFNAVVVHHADPTRTPYLFWVTKTRVGVFHDMVKSKFDHRKREKNAMKSLKMLGTEANKRGAMGEGSESAAAAAVEDHRVVTDALATIEAEGKVANVDEVCGRTKLDPKQVAEAASRGAAQADVVQKVLKIVNNAMFGASGFQPKQKNPNYIPAPTEVLPLAACTTSEGQRMNKATERHLLEGVVVRGEKVSVVKIAGDTDSVIVKQDLTALIDMLSVAMDGVENITVEDVVKEAWKDADEMAKSVYKNVFHEDGHSFLEVDGIGRGYYHGKKMRAELLWTHPKAPPERVVKGMKPARVNDVGIVRNVAQRFIDLVFDAGDFQITGFRLLLINVMWDWLERMLLAPGEEGYREGDYVQVGHAYEEYITKTMVNNLNPKGSLSSHLVALRDKVKREGLPAHYYQGDYIAWVTEMGNSSRVSDRAVEASYSTWSKLDLVHYLEAISTYMSSIFRKPWRAGDNSAILHSTVWGAMCDVYRKRLSAKSSKLFAAAHRASDDVETPRDRLDKFHRLLLEAPKGVPAAPVVQAQGRRIDTFFATATTTAAAAPMPSASAFDTVIHPIDAAAATSIRKRAAESPLAPAQQHQKRAKKQHNIASFFTNTKKK